MTINDLAKMVAKGFEQTATKQDLLNLATKQDLLAFRMEEVQEDIQALRNTVNSHLDLSDKRYLEFKRHLAENN